MNDEFSIVPSLGISVNDSCMMRCSYCPDHGENLKETDSLAPLGSILLLLRAAKKHGIKVVRLTGGEPLNTAHRTRTLLEECVRLGFPKIILNTNGLLLDENMTWLSDLAGLFECKVSLDTVREDVFTKITGVNALKSVLCGIQSAREARLDLTANIVVSRANRANVFEVLAYVEANGLNGKIFDVFDFYGANKNHWEEFCDITDLFEEISLIYPTLGEERLPGGRGILMPVFRLDNGKHLLFVQHHAKQGHPRVFNVDCTGCGSYPCATGLFQLAMRSDGFVSLCKKRINGFDIRDVCAEQDTEAIIQKLLFGLKRCFFSSKNAGIGIAAC